jgi:type I restriction enzyme S subunit
MLRSDTVQKMIELYSSGSAQPQLPIKDMRKMKIIKPIEEILSRFAEITNDMLYQAALLQNQSQNLARQRDLLLPRLMGGKLEV